MTCQPNCCAGRDEHERVKRITREWLELPAIGVQRYTEDDGSEVALDMRNAPCGSTIARRIVEPMAVRP